MAKYITLNQAQKKLSQLPDEIIDEPMIITDKDKPVIIAMSPSQLDSLLETIEILSDQEFCQQLKIGIEELNRGETFSLEEVKDELGL
ncbi:type II toxin-antitoxin system Phd/YefM family antitoxin [Crocosphaera watsonii WH 8501]|uniref:Antitoxin n=6 Tax=Crocosphaera watsonii TaxID=263511 RepID=Q4C7V9_CROWT|nr:MULTISPECIES: type II toxin-antitoxin system Phd/YefM family antitoxin [Crocosphaera]EAM52512.1 Prevent-host-death protein [Crocosphaera watsonii WH 8501]EHJ14270.1 Prevent-host-death protein [Crocosphaera watsonii WH 0003]MCH2243456.1 type II toxin-antitoxin system Phd/YefM family antitoxin [Crocosphaera sp.]NQZ64111.1 type II toxin-antitoxin system Phd/YefM family antitoxin [Crocosphaera sp.]CCQ53185.1 Prevent-host-death protein [Crocosphaera watsonii WH 8502]